jgi:hypothetical protein
MSAVNSLIPASLIYFAALVIDRSRKEHCALSARERGA